MLSETNSVLSSVVQINHKEGRQDLRRMMSCTKTDEFMATLKPTEVGTTAPGQAKVCKFIPLVLEMAQGNSQR